VSGLYGGAGTGTLSLDIAAPPQASFYFDPFDPSTSDTIQFYDNSYDLAGVGIETWEWDFGDGTPHSTDQFPTHMYAADGDYPVTLTVMTFDGRSASVTQIVQVRTPDTVVVEIDIKPGRFPNRIKLRRNVCRDDDNVYVAILTTPAFNARTVNVSTVQLGDPNLSGKATPIKGRITDVDRDGDKDMVLTFTLCSIVTNGALNINSTQLVLTGKTSEGTDFTGSDSVKVVR
jgi:PKD repeat protein